MTQSKNVKAGSISLPDAKGDATIDMHTIKEFAESLTAASSIFTGTSISGISATTYSDGNWYKDTSKVNSILYNDIWLNEQTLWEERLPGVNEVNALAEEYPAFAKAYEQFRTAYNLVIDDWKSKDE
jgi:hypothetical protein